MIVIVIIITFPSNTARNRNREFDGHCNRDRNRALVIDVVIRCCVSEDELKLGIMEKLEELKRRLAPSLPSLSVDSQLKVRLEVGWGGGGGEAVVGGWG